ncbi:uncharacterized protein LOC121295824 [Polyodon spathula]|uniref:uncharacterized protein LOC121295824 n=1 Tax=Polyodon spathula TaxID=7913 RepID=UPI001B7DE0FB|nr:uncharacterized protein LOC121295824 [Polyodon spathula]
MERAAAVVLTVLLLRGFECSSEASPGVHCLIHDEDYTECTWKETGRPDRNYTFQSRYRTGAEYAECPSYTQVEGYNVGCRLEYSSNIRFATFQVQLSSADNTAIWNKDINLKPLVKLYSPVNLTVVNSRSNGLYLYWNTSMSKSQCLESIVRYRSSTDSAWQSSPPFISVRYFDLPFADGEELYEFQVKIRMNEFCGASDYWSDWSQPVYWGSNATAKGVHCLIHDEDYTECTWKETGRPDHNYTFQSRYRTGAEYAECPSYTQVEGYNVGCRLEYSSNIRFATFQVQLSSADNTAIWNKDINLKPLVKLYSPVNLTVVNSSSNGLYLYWNTSMSKSQCLESIVRYRSSMDSAWQSSPPFISVRYFNLPFADGDELYEFQVKIRMNEFCGASDYWSDWSQPVYWGSNATAKGVHCLIHDEDYTECTWKETGRPDRNYTFQSRYRSGAEYAECPSYTQVEGYNVGCRLEYSSNIRFATFQVQLSSANNTAIWNKDINLKPLVKLYSPVNLTVVNSSSNGLYLYWNTSMSKSQCLESIVRYRSSTDSAWQSSPPFISVRYFNLPFADGDELYEFQVKIRMNEFCGASDYWSDWSQPVYWGSNATAKGINRRDKSFDPSVVIYPIVGSAVLFILAWCLIHNERLRIILVPVIPNPGKNFEELFNSYDGNFQEWLHVSKDIVDGFKPNFSEPVCTVRERAGSVSDSCGGPGGSVRSNCSLLIPGDDPDCISTSSASSSSTLPAPPYEV